MLNNHSLKYFWITALISYASGVSAVDPANVDLKNKESQIHVAQPPFIDTSKAKVPLASIIFDTFDGKSVSLAQASRQRIESLRDRIRPIYHPRYDSVEKSHWLAPNDLVIGYIGKKAAYAYPIKILNFHEIVIDVIEGIPILVSYCPLCGSGIVFNRSLKNKILLFGNTSALYENDMVMFDHQTGSYWFQVAGEAIVGPLTGAKLKLLPSVMMEWQSWKKAFPGSKILSKQQDMPGKYPYQRDPFRDYPEQINNMNFPFPVSQHKIQSVLNAGEVVLTVKVDKKANSIEKAYPLARLGETAVNDRIANQHIVIFSRGHIPSGNAFFSTVDSQQLQFRIKGENFVDQQTGSVWNYFGAAIKGPLKGKQLKPIMSRRAFWFAISIAIPDIQVYRP